jgi:hypothetical protein
MKAVEADAVANQPTSSRSQVHVLTAHKAYVFDAIPDIGWGHADFDADHWLGYGDTYGGRHVGNRAAGGQRGDDCEQTHYSDIFHFHIHSMAERRHRRHKV